MQPDEMNLMQGGLLNCNMKYELHHSLTSVLLPFFLAFFDCAHGQPEPSVHSIPFPFFTFSCYFIFAFAIVLFMCDTMSDVGNGCRCSVAFAVGACVVCGVSFLCALLFCWCWVVNLPAHGRRKDGSSAGDYLYL